MYTYLPVYDYYPTNALQLAENQRALLLEEENRNLVRQLEEMGSRKVSLDRYLSVMIFTSVIM